MRRLVWLGLGAAGGIVAYRKISEIVAESQEKGVVLTIADFSTSLRNLAVVTGEQVGKLRESTNTGLERASNRTITGSAAAAVNNAGHTAR